MKHWSEVDDAAVRQHFVVEQKSYGQIANLYEGATVGAVAGRCRRLGLKRGTSRTIGVKLAGRGGPVVMEREDFADTLARIGPIFEVAAEIGMDRVEFARKVLRSVGPPAAPFSDRTAARDYVLACCRRALDFKAKHEAARPFMSVVAMRQETQRREFLPGKVRLEDLESHSCRWPEGDPGHADFGFCGKRRDADVPYCCAHRKLAYSGTKYEKQLRKPRGA